MPYHPRTPSKYKATINVIAIDYSRLYASNMIIFHSLCSLAFFGQLDILLSHHSYILDDAKNIRIIKV